MDLPNAETVFKAAVWLISAVGAWVWWSLGRSMVRRPEFEAFRAQHQAEHVAMSARLSRGDARFDKLESTLSHLPTKEETLALRVQMERLAGDLRVTQTLVTKVEEPMRVMIDHAIEHARR